MGLKGKELSFRLFLKSLLIKKIKVVGKDKFYYFVVVRSR